LAGCSAFEEGRCIPDSPRSQVLPVGYGRHAQESVAGPDSLASLTIVGNWRKCLTWLFKKSGVKGARSHRFRDTFSVSLLERGVDIETVSVPLGHASIKVTERHYRPWVKSLQTNLEEAVRRTWIQAVA